MEEKNSVRIQRWKQNAAHSAHGLTSYQSADIIRTGTLSALKAAKREDNHQVKVRRRPNGTFDVLVFDAVPQRPDRAAAEQITGKVTP